MFSTSIVSNLEPQITGIIKAIVCGQKIGREAGRNIDLVKRYGGYEFVQIFVFKRT